MDNKALAISVSVSCVHTPGEVSQHCVMSLSLSQIMSGGENVLVLTASSEEEFALWMSALCEAATGQERVSV